MEVDITYSLHRLFRVEGHEAEASVALGLLIHEHDCVFDEAELGEVNPHFFSGRVLADPTDEYLFSLCWPRCRFGSGMLRVNALAVQGVDGHGEDLVHGGGVLERDEAEAARPLRGGVVSVYLG